MAKHTPVHSPSAETVVTVSVLHSSLRLPLGSLLTATSWSCALPFRPAAFPKGVWLSPRDMILSQSEHKMGGSSVGQWQKRLLTVATMMCMGQHRAAQLNVGTWIPILYVAWGCSVTCATTGTSCDPLTRCHQLPSLQTLLYACCMGFGLQAEHQNRLMSCGQGSAPHGCTWTFHYSHGPTGPVDRHVCRDLVRPCVHPQAGVGQAWSLWSLRML